MMYRFYNLPLVYDFLKCGGQLVDIRTVFSSIIGFDSIKFLALDFITLLAILILSRFFSISSLDDAFFKRSNFFVIFSMLFLFGAGLFNYKAIGLFSNDSIKHPCVKLALFNPFNFYVIEAIDAVENSLFPETFTPEQIKKYDLFNKHLQCINGAQKPLTEKPNFLFILMESLRTEMLDYKVDGKLVMPHLKDLSKKSLFFKNHYSQSYTTCDAYFTLFSSLILPSDKLSISFYKKSVPYLPGVLRKNGWSTAAMHGVRRSFWQADKAFQAFGFDDFYAVEDFSGPNGFEKIGLGVSDHDLYARSTKIISDFKSPWFYMVVSLSSHFPFKCKSGPDNIMGKTGDKLFDNYVNALNYADEEVAGFLKSLEQKGLLKNTVVVIFGDHTIRMDDSFNRTRQELLKSINSTQIRDELIHLADSRVPLIIYSPDYFVPKIDSRICNQIDVAPTLLSLCNIRIPDTFCGQNLFSDTRINCAINKMGLGVSERGFFNDRGYFLPQTEDENNKKNGDNRPVDFCSMQLEYSHWILSTKKDLNILIEKNNEDKNNDRI